MTNLVNGEPNGGEGEEPEEEEGDPICRRRAGCLTKRVGYLVTILDNDLESSKINGRQEGPRTQLFQIDLIMI